MRGYLFLLLCGMGLLASAPPAQAINLFGRHPKVDPKVRVPQLLVTARTAPQERQRLAAVEELRQYDAAAFPQIIPVLLELLRSDPSAAVRAEAAYSLGRLRPASAEVAQALKAALHDPALRVRWQARSALMFYPAPPSPQPPVTARTPASNPVPMLGGSASPGYPLPTPPPYLVSPPVSRSTPEPPPATAAPAEIARPLPRGPEPPPVAAPSGPPPVTSASRGEAGRSQTGANPAGPAPAPAAPAGPLEGPELPPP